MLLLFFFWTDEFKTFFFLWGALGGVCITKAGLVLHTNDVTSWHALRTAAALSMSSMFSQHIPSFFHLIQDVISWLVFFLTHCTSNSSYLCLSYSGIEVVSRITSHSSLTLVSLTPFPIPRHLSWQRIQYEQKANICLNGSGFRVQYWYLKPIYSFKALHSQFIQTIEHFSPLLSILLVIKHLCEKGALQPNSTPPPSGWKEDNAWCDPPVETTAKGEDPPWWGGGFGKTVRKGEFETCC